MVQDSSVAEEPVVEDALPALAPATGEESVEAHAAESGSEAAGHEEASAEAAGHDEPGHAEPGHESAGHESAGHESAGHDDPGHGEPGHSDSGHGDTGHGELGHGHDDLTDHAHNPLDPGHLIGHVKDATYFEVPRAFASEGKLQIPQLRDWRHEPVFTMKTGVPMVDDMQLLAPFDLKFTKFMALELLGAMLIAVVFIWYAGRVENGEAPKGKLTNFLDAFLVFIRDQIARPAIGHHDADRFLPFLWTLFFFILAGNLLGMVPWLGSYTGALATTGTLAFITFLVVTGAGMMKMGPLGFWFGQVPHMDVPSIAIKAPLWLMIFAIEILGMVIKHFVLSVRLLANMFAGHIVLAVLIIFIKVAADYSFGMFLVVTPASLAGALAISMLELFVAFLQAYIFTFLASLFIGMAVHSH